MVLKVFINEFDGKPDEMDENRISSGVFVKFPSGSINAFFAIENKSDFTSSGISDWLVINALEWRSWMKIQWWLGYSINFYLLIISVISRNHTDDSWNYTVVLRNHSDDLVFRWLVRGYVRRVFGECNIPLAPFKGGLMRLMNFEGKMKDFSF